MCPPLTFYQECTTIHTSWNRVREQNIYRKIGIPRKIGVKRIEPIKFYYCFFVHAFFFFLLLMGGERFFSFVLMSMELKGKMMPRIIQRNPAIVPRSHFDTKVEFVDLFTPSHCLFSGAGKGRRCTWTCNAIPSGQLVHRQYDDSRRCLDPSRSFCVAGRRRSRRGLRDEDLFLLFTVFCYRMIPLSFLATLYWCPIFFLFDRG